ncbi:YkvA family protein [Pseudochryseolinea flava]|uniref:DUF1232 domain-containing protein n=1 Tax=Pseudochryseolinea flava TaxID=2059302 RepID=A0A364XZI5_9BACT|nr:YkvA family protein [Pseudochryseolinea flava]RAV99415.1 hypothetical protein DQQ10_19535 [Pseudochryseolinea flava]
MGSNNPFFKIALNKASKWLGKPGRVLKLVVDLSQKIRSVNWKEVKGGELKEMFFTMGRMLKAYATGKYREVPWKALLLIAAAVIYFVNPIDLIPDWIPGLGITDDLGILTTVYKSVSDEVQKFVAWEKANQISIEAL